MKKVIKGSIGDIQKQLDNYLKEYFNKLEQFENQLANYGISVAQANTGGFGSKILFSIDTNPQEDGCSMLIRAVDSSKIYSVWQTKDGVKTAEVSPLLMAEFGSGKYADNPKRIEGVGRGTFLGQKHAFNEEGWYWLDLNNVWHHSSGIVPKMPMYKASQEMEDNASRIASEVFG